jgi:hypothetical protein
MSASPEVAMTTLEIAAIGELKFEVPKGGQRRSLGELLLMDRCGTPPDEALGQAILDEPFIFLPDDGFFSPGAPEEKLVRVRTEFIEFIVLDVVNTRLLEILQGTVWRDRDELIPGSHREFVQG